MSLKRMFGKLIYSRLIAKHQPSPTGLACYHIARSSTRSATKRDWSSGVEFVRESPALETPGEYEVDPFDQPVEQECPVASQVRKRLNGHGFGVRKVFSDGKNRAVIIHTATEGHLRDLEALCQDVIGASDEAR